MKIYRMHLRRELLCRAIKGKQKVHVDLFNGLRAVDGVLRLRIDNSVSDRESCFFYINLISATISYAIVTSSFVEASVAYATPRDLAANIISLICYIISLFCYSQINGACGVGERLLRRCWYR